MDDAMIPEINLIITHRIFADDAFCDPCTPRPIVKGELGRLVASITANVWHKMRKRVGNQYARLCQRKEAASDAFESNCALYHVSCAI